MQRGPATVAVALRASALVLGPGHTQVTGATYFEMFAVHWHCALKQSLLGTVLEQV